MNGVAQREAMEELDVVSSMVKAAMVDDRMIYYVKEIENTSADKKWYLTLKRMFDFLGSIVGIIILFIPCLIISALIVLDSPGSPIYIQERLGLRGKPFYIYKFRTMFTDAEKNGAQWAEENDPRVTKVGRILRATRMDEFPQLINIFKGDMSIVGPRPERACFYDKFSEYIHGFAQRLEVTPGLTGLAQVNGGYDIPPQEKIAWDVEYIEKRGFWLDLKIIFKTILIVFSHEGAR